MAEQPAPDGGYTMFSATRNLFAQIIKKRWQESFTPELSSSATSSSLGEI